MSHQPDSLLKPDKTWTVEVFEKLVLDQQYEKASLYLLSLLEKLQDGIDFGKADRSNWYNRVVSSTFRLFSDTDFEISDQGFLRFARLYPVLNGLIATSGFNNADHIITQCYEQGEKGAGGQITLTRVLLYKVLLLRTFDSKQDISVQQVYQAAPNVFWHYVMSTLSARVVIGEEDEAYREKLLRFFSLGFDNTELTGNWQGAFSRAWMMCSYGLHKEKHRVKKALNGLVKDWFIKQEIVCPVTLNPVQPAKAKPLIVVMLESFNSNHAVYRCYRHVIESLRADFQLIAMAEKGKIDESGTALFDSVHEWDDVINSIPSMADTLVSLKPDMIYYVSLGMAPWTIILANQRFAPIQFMTHGHPATSHSDSIDYYIMGRHVLGDKSLCSEKIVVLDAPGSLYSPHSEAVGYPASVRKPAERVVKIAIPAISFKINSQLLRLCQQLQKQSDKRLEFHFFPNLPSGSAVDYFVKQVEKYLSNVKAYDRTDYRTYLKHLDKCDLALSPFPFGGANSTIDVLQLGIPIVTWIGNEVHSRTDYRVLSSLGFADQLASESLEDYESTALLLIRDDGKRKKLSKQIIKKNISKLLFKEESGKYKLEFCNTVRWLYDHHDRINNESRKVWRLKDRLKIT